MNYLKPVLFSILLGSAVTHAQSLFDFENNVQSGSLAFEGDTYDFVQGIDGRALSLSSHTGYSNLVLPNLALDGSKDFTVQFWIRTSSDKPTVFLAQKDFKSKGIGNQINPGWALYGSGGTWAWCIGSGKRRINYERDNGDKMPVSDGRWHQLTMTYSNALTEARLYYDGRHVAAYKVGFDFTNAEPLRIGVPGNGSDDEQAVLPEIEEGAANLQAFVDAFNQLDVGSVKAEEFIDLIVDPEKLYRSKMKTKGVNEPTPDPEKLEAVSRARKKLYSSPYTVYQNRNLTLLKPVSQIYALNDGKVTILSDIAKRFTSSEQLHAADFSIDQLVIRDDVLDSDAIQDSYRKYRKSTLGKPAKHLKSLNVGVWNIWHGGIHFTNEKDGWDSRLRIVEILQKHEVDVVLMQETYSNGDFIAAELGFYLATTSDWDYCFQGSNISVISRYPIKELSVLPETEFNNVAVKLSISETQEIYAMSNWYGMQSFSYVYAFYESRFEEADQSPVFFGGDFNAVPHTDGGESPASVKMLDNGFTDAYRSLHPDIERYPGYTHQSGHRIDQLYYKGKGLKNTSTIVISDSISKFPSDHFLIFSEFSFE